MCIIWELAQKKEILRQSCRLIKCILSLISHRYFQKSPKMDIAINNFCESKSRAFLTPFKREKDFWTQNWKWLLFLGPKFWFLVQKSDFCHMTPILVNDPFLALGMTVNFPPWERFFDFPFRSYSSFRKKIRLTCQKVFPPPNVGAPSASNSPSALSAQALGPVRARAG